MNVWSAVSAGLLPGGAVFILIQGMKNLPGIQKVVNSNPWVPVLTNVVLSMLIAFATCMSQSSAILMSCIVTALSSIGTASGAHYVYSATTTSTTTSTPTGSTTSSTSTH